MDAILKEAIRLAKKRDYTPARELLTKVLRKDSDNEIAWLWMSQVVRTDRERMVYLRQVLRVNPENGLAQKGIEYLTASALEPKTYQLTQVVSTEVSTTIQEPPVSLDLLPSESPPSIHQSAVQTNITVQPAISLERQVAVRELVLNWWRRFSIRVSLSWRQFKRSWAIFAQNRLAVIGLVLIFLYGIMAVAHPILINTVWPQGIYDPITGYDFKVMHPSPPSKTHLLGTDSMGRDVLSMLLLATTPAFVLGLTAALVTAFTGTLIGVISAYFGGKMDTVLTRVSDAFLLLPAPLFMVIVGVAFKEFGPIRLGALFGVIAGLGGAAVTLRSHAFTVIARPYIDMARIAGGGARHIILRHVIPHMLPMAATLMMISVIGAVVADAFVSFFGFTRLYLNWGTMIYISQAYSNVFGSTDWHVLLPPSIALSLFAASFYLIARGLHEVADPKLRTP